MLPGSHQCNSDNRVCPMYQCDVVLCHDGRNSSFSGYHAFSSSLFFSVPSLVPSLVSSHGSFSLSISLLLSTALCLSLLLLCIVALLLLRHHILKHRPQTLDLTEFIADLCISLSATFHLHPLLIPLQP